MAIQVGDKIPSMTFKTMGPDGLADATTEEIFGGKTVALFSVPGAYTPTCTAKHVPSYRDNADALKGKGVDSIVCLSVNDPFVMKAWGESLNVGDKVTMLPDWNGEFSKALDLTIDGSGAGLGTRGARFSLLIRDGVVEQVNVEEVPSDMTVSGAEHMLSAM